MITVDFRKLDIAPKDRILDIGCGAGRHACEASKHHDVMTIGADIDFDTVLEAKEKLSFHEKFGYVRGKWKTFLADILSLPFSDAAFDLVICSEVLEHIVDHRQAISEIIRVLKPGKNLVVTVPRYLPEQICWWLSEAYHTAKNGHVRIYKQTDLTRLLESAGARIWAHHWAHGLHAPYWWLKCLIGPDRKDSTAVNAYHRFLVWDMMKKPKLTRFSERLLNPILGKSLVLYLRKQPDCRQYPAPRTHRAKPFSNTEP